MRNRGEVVSACPGPFCPGHSTGERPAVSRLGELLQRACNTQTNHIFPWNAQCSKGSGIFRLRSMTYSQPGADMSMKMSNLC